MSDRLLGRKLVEKPIKSALMASDKRRSALSTDFKSPSASFAYTAGRYALRWVHLSHKKKEWHGNCTVGAAIHRGLLAAHHNTTHENIQKRKLSFCPATNRPRTNVPVSKPYGLKTGALSLQQGVCGSDSSQVVRSSWGFVRALAPDPSSALRTRHAARRSCDRAGHTTRHSHRYGTSRNKSNLTPPKRMKTALSAARKLRMSTETETQEFP